MGRWCKGIPGREHVAAAEFIAFHPWYRECGPAQGWLLLLHGPGWRCGHREACQECGQILRGPWKLTREECPVWRERGHTEAA